MSVSFDFVSATQAASATFVEQHTERRGTSSAKLAQKLLIIAQYNSGKAPTPNVPVEILSLGDIQARAGRGSMAAHMYEAAMRHATGIRTYWLPLADDATGVVATRTITVTGPATSAGVISLLVGGRKVTVSVAKDAIDDTIAAAIAAAINADLDNLYTAAAASEIVTCTLRNKGVWGNSVQIIEDPDLGDLTAEPAGVSLVIAAGATGTVDPVLTTALGNLGDTFYTVVASPYNTDTQLDAIESAFDVRLAPAVKRPFITVVGYTDTLANYTTALADRNSPAITYVPVEGSPNAPLEIAAVAAGLLAKSYDSKPGVPCKGIKLKGIRANASYAPWTGAQRDTIVKLGGSWTKVDESGAVLSGDFVTTYVSNSQGVEDAGDYWRFTSTLSNLQYKINALDVLINSDPYINCVVVDDNSPSNAQYVVKPKGLKADLRALVDSWIKDGLSKNRDQIVANITVEINASNPTRLDAYIPDIIAAGGRIIGVRYGWSLNGAA